MSIAYKISEFNRNKKWREFLNNIKFSQESTVLDVGYSNTEYSSTDNYIHKHYPYPEKMTALGIDTPTEFAKRYPAVKVIQYNGRIFPFEDESFDICWSNAVIEHVGNKEKQLVFIKEISRTSKVAFITSPNRYFPVEVHTRVPLLHFLPKNIFDRFLSGIGKSWAAGDYMNLLSLQDIKGLLKEAGVTRYKIIKNRLLFFTLDYVIIWE